MSASYETVGYSLADGVATVTLNRPSGLNSWNEAMGEDLVAALDAAGADDAVRSVVITGAGRAFCSGADLRGGFTPGPDGKPDLKTRIDTVYNPTIRRMRTLELPVIAAVNGPAVGVGCSLALAADVVIAAESAYFLLAFANIGLSIDGGASALLAGRVGYGRAAEFALLADRVSAAEALTWNLINRVVPDGELETAAAELAARFVAGPPRSYAAIKTLLNESCYPTLDSALGREGDLQGELGRSADFAEGVAAFSEKRPATFTGA